MRDWSLAALAALPFVSVLMAACATTVGEGAMGRPSGPVAWEIVDVRERVSVDGQWTRWYYTIVFKETQGRTIQFQKEHIGKYRNRRGSSREAIFEQRLEPYSELRINRAQTLRNRPASAIVVFRHYEATDAADRTLGVDVRIPLSPGTGRRMTNPEVTGSLPPARHIDASESSALTGTWQGYQRDAQGFVVPVALALERDGSFEAAVDDPPRYRVRGTLRVRDGHVIYSAGSDTGTLTLHGRDGKRVLVGNVIGRRHVRPADQSFDLDPTLGVLTRSPGPTYTVEYALRLELQA